MSLCSWGKGFNVEFCVFLYGIKSKSFFEILKILMMIMIKIIIVTTTTMIIMMAH